MAERGSEARDRPRRRAGQGPQDRHLRHRHPYLQLGRMGAEDDPDADDDRPRICRRDRRARRQCAPPAARPARVGRGPRDRHGQPRRARRALSSRPGDARHRRQHSRRFRRIRARAGVQHRAAARRRRRRARRDPRSARQRRPHRAVVRSGRRGRAGHRRRADRHHGGGGGAPRRRPPCRHHRHQSAPPRARRRSRRRHAGRRVAPGPARRDGARSRWRRASTSASK